MVDTNPVPRVETIVVNMKSETGGILSSLIKPNMISLAERDSRIVGRSGRNQ